MEESITSAAGCGWVGGVILLICEPCQRPLEDESLSGRVTYSDNVHTEGGWDLSSGLGWGWCVCV